MASALLNQDSLTAQVAGDLERQIATGVLPPLAKLKGVRELAKQYGVSKNIALAALKELDKKRLIRREERKGIFVSEMASNPQVSEVLVLLFRQNPVRSPFAMQILSAISCREAAGKINFYIRAVTHDEADDSPHEYWTRQLEAEVAKLAHTFHSDCVLIAGSRFLKQDVEIALRLPFPTLFVGNFQEGDYPDLAYNRLGQSSNYHDAAVNYAARQGMRDLLFFYPTALNDAAYYHTAFDRMKKLAAETGLRIHAIQVDHVRDHREEVWQKSFRRAAREAAATGVRDGLCYLFCIAHGKTLIEFLREQGFQPGAGRFECLINPAYRMEIRGDYVHYVDLAIEEKDRFNLRLVEYLQQLTANPEAAPFIEDFPLEYSII